MDKGYFMNAGIPPPPQQLDAIPWNFTTADQLIDHHHNFLDQYSHYESALSSMVSSPVSAAAQSNDPFLLRELIGKLGGGDHHHHPFAQQDTTRGNNNNNYSSSSNNIPLSPPKLLQQLPPIPHQKHSLSPSLGKPVALTPPQLGDPGFAERAAKFSCFGSRSFNGRTSPLVELPNRSQVLMGTAKLPRVSSSPSLKQSGSAFENRTETGTPDKKLSKLSGSGANSNEESSVSEQIPSGNNSNEMSSRKRKGVSRAKPKEDGSNQVKGGGGDDGNAKRLKAIESGKNENGDKKPEDEVKSEASDENEKQKANQKPPEPPKDYIHVRARRGQATDSHSLAERVRREKISERMKLLQDLVPGCNKVTGKALMLDEIINYVQSLQRQVEFLSMKLASVNPDLDFNMDNLHSKDMFQRKATLPQQMYPLDSSAPALYQQNVQQQLHSSTNISRGQLSQCTVDPHPLPLGTQLPSLDGFTEGLTQFPAFSEDDLHSIVGFAHNHVNFPVLNQMSNAKVEQ